MIITRDSHGDWDAPYTPEDARRAVNELLNSAGADGLHEDELTAAMNMFGDLFTTAALLDLWMDHKVRLGWRDGELTYQPTAPTTAGKDNT